MTRTSQNLFLLTCIFTSLLLLTECRGQSKDIQNCKAEYWRASDALNNYYMDSNQAHLSAAFASLDSALKCNEMRSKAVSLKITLLLVAKKYKEGYEFVRPLDPASFSKPYEKYCFENWFLAHVLDAKSDSTARDSVYRQMEIRLENYINAGRGFDGDFDDLAVSSLYVVKWQLEGKKVLNEIDSLEKIWPKRKDFFNYLRVMLQNKPYTASTEAH